LSIPVQKTNAPKKIHPEVVIKSLQAAAVLAKKDAAEKERKAALKAKVEARHEAAMAKKIETERLMNEKREVVVPSKVKVVLPGGKGVPKSMHGQTLPKKHADALKVCRVRFMSDSLMHLRNLHRLCSKLRRLGCVRLL
jgi:hypothetical protein